MAQSGNGSSEPFSLAAMPYRLEKRLVVQDNISITQGFEPDAIGDTLGVLSKSLNPTLCEPCQMIAETISTPRYWINHGDRFSLARSARTCALCKILWDALEPDLEQRERDFLQASEEEQPVKRGFRGQLRSRLSRELKAKISPARNKVIISYDIVKAFSRTDIVKPYPFRKSGYGSCRIHTTQDNSAASFIEARTICPSTDSDEAFRLVQSWIDTCTKTHSTCRTLSNTKLPLRLLDVGSLQETGREPFLSTNHPELGRYACLSYCWGGPQTTITTLSTLQERKTSIPLRDLPRTIRDAVCTTRRLGIKYLWVDSLCIIQDSHEDWNKQAALMGEVYSNAFITIAAAASTNCHGGSFATRTLRPEASFKLNVRDSDGGAGAAFIGPDAELVDFHTGTTVYNTSPNSWMNQKTVLDERGWTLQESLLSTRVLKYTSNMMLWTCRAVSLREDGAAYQYTHSENDEFRHFMEHLHSQIKRKNDILADASANNSAANNPDLRPDSPYIRGKLEEITRQVLYAWYLLVEEYSTRRLTFQSDRLPAMAGVADKMAAETEDVYIHGLWQSDLARGLAWDSMHARPFNVSQSENGTSPSQTRDAPSWSWAAAGGAVRTNMTHYWDYWELKKKDPSYDPPEPLVRVVPMPAGTVDTISSAPSPAMCLDMCLTVEALVREADQQEIDTVTSQQYYDERYMFDQHSSITATVVRESKRMLGLYLQVHLELLIVPVVGLEGVYRRIGLGAQSNWRRKPWPQMKGGRDYNKKIITLC
ncbi:heterokaryon incompatibility protein-domain-containing protein [Cadophora sp. MPI-SDFR-AT-0126]|nr:heterokaryon incompatibility protein-domain-containing protein [Leotiomycetes sp. MPI-SDFR-AT-0126]